MFSQVLLVALAVSPLVAAHGKVSVITGDLGGNGTALGIKGAVVMGAGQNYQTETDTTVFWSQNIRTDNDLGYTEDGTGNNVLDNIVDTMALSGTTLPQVSAGGFVNGTYHIVTTDGAGPVAALIDTTGTGKWSNATEMEVMTQPAGVKGEIAGTSTEFKRSIITRGLEKLGVISKRATNVNRDYAMKIAIPSNATCTGIQSGQTNLCLVKVSNQNAAGPFGGVFYVQMGTTAAARVKRITSFTA